MTRNENSASGGYLPRLILSWLIVGVLLVYGISQAIIASVPLFAS